ncbi:hypothetical protein [Pseudomonas vanderleydeniana]|uniref:Uncharacterized protein n=1 Tax=Pseudomonas vanderleydeniana TaxID=2745495 RepID=A0A9E6PJ22_9PSED|nr:hypothetical protein [Pseudomonas vanderleydeniana]QXI27031.1 hypothetical protein HU752_024385 [Pseudomonas vanderleydeniana]
MSAHEPCPEQPAAMRMLLAHLQGLAVAALLILGLTLLACLLLPVNFR